MIFSIAVTVATTAAMVPPSGNPLARAETGQLQCYRPDVSRRTCQSIASYIRTGESTYDNKAIVAVSNEATLETHTPVVLRAGSVCGYIRAEDILGGILRLRGTELAPDAAKPVLQKIAQSVAPFAGKAICTRYEPSGMDFIAKVSIAATYRPDQDVEVRWIDPSDGYSVTP